MYSVYTATQNTGYPCRARTLQILCRDNIMPVNFQKEKKELVTDFHLTPDVLSQKVSREHKLVIQQTISWKPVGEFLLDEVDLKDIDKDGFDEPEKRAEMLAKWQERFGRGATYEKLIDAMIKAGKKTEAEGVCQLIEPVTPGQ